MRTTRFSIAALAILFLFTLSARAIPLPTVTINIVGDGTELTGSFTEVLGGDAPIGNFQYFDGTNTYTFDFSNATGGDNGPDSNFYLDVLTNLAGDRFYFGGLQAPPSTSFDQFICSIANPCSTGGVEPETFISFVNPAGTDDQHFVSDGQVVFALPSAVPEPSSLVLLGTGVIGALGAVRRRFTL